MKGKTLVVIVLVTACATWAQSPEIIRSTKKKLDEAQKTWNAQQGVADDSSSSSAKPSAATPAKSEKPMVVRAEPVVRATAMPAKSPAPSKSAKSKKKTGKGRKAPVQAAVAAVSKPEAGTPAQGNAISAAPVAGSAAGEEHFAALARRDASKRDPFISPVISRMSGPGNGCTGGKRCLEVGSINLRGIVKSENGMIAVVVNAANKAYFLRENDPLFNGYVVKITDDSVMFRETVQDALGHQSSRDVVKKLFVPAV